MSGQKPNEAQESDEQPLLTAEQKEPASPTQQPATQPASPTQASPAQQPSPTQQPVSPTQRPVPSGPSQKEASPTQQPVPNADVLTPQQPTKGNGPDVEAQPPSKPTPKEDRLASDLTFPFMPSRSMGTELQTASLPAYRKPDKKPSIMGLNFFRSSNTRVSFDDGQGGIDLSQERFVITAAEMEGVPLEAPMLPRTKAEIKAARHYSLRESGSKIIDKENELKRDGKTPQLLGYQFKLAFSSLGIVFGDVGTSPLYTFSSIFPEAPPSREDTLGALSLIIWTILIIVAIKYITFMLMANDRGEGGPFALYSLLSRNLKHHIKDPVTLRRVTYLFEILACVGVAAVLSDGVLTPSISVLGAVQGLEVAAEVESQVVVGVSIGIVLILFLIQQLGTSRVSFMFSPFMIIWFASLFSIGVYNITLAPEVLTAFSPAVGVEFFVRNDYEAWVTLGSVFLCVTGAEATFADMGHFTGMAVRLSALIVVVPSLLACYCGQAARLLQEPELKSNTFFNTLPSPVFYPMLVLSFLAAVTSSQAIISATFSLVSQAIQLDMFPKLTLKHTDKHHIGQIYVPEINYFYMVIVVCVIAAYRDSVALGNAYGIAVAAAMFIDSIYFACIIHYVWGYNWIFSLLFFGWFGLVDGTFLSSNLLKFPTGGWFAVTLTVIASTVLIVWHWGRRRMVSTRKHLFTESFGNFFQKTNPAIKGVTVMKNGICICYSSFVDCVSPAYLHYLSCVPCLPRYTVFVHIRPLRQAFAKREIVVESIPCDIPDLKIYRCIIDNGYKQESPNAEFLGAALVRRLDPNARHFFLVSQDHVSSPPDSGLVHRFFVRCFELLLGISRTGIKDLDFPADRCLEIGITIPIPRKELILPESPKAGDMA